jgi:antitoxin (DNA-binding transcriptional repressor) of toxin-antitoxin stability system
VVITESNVPVAMLVKPQPGKSQPIAGRGKGTLTIYSEDDDHLEDFKEYLP